MAATQDTGQFERYVIGNIGVDDLLSPRGGYRILSGIVEVEDVGKRFLCKDRRTYPGVQDKLQRQCVVQHDRHNDEVVVHLNGYAHAFPAIGKSKAKGLAKSCRCGKTKKNQ